MDRSEMVEILETIARESPNQSAKVAAIRALRQLDAEEEEKKPVGSDPFAELDLAKPKANFADLDEVRDRKRFDAWRTKGKSA